MSAAAIDFPALACRPVFRQSLLRMMSAAHDAMRGVDADLGTVAAVTDQLAAAPLTAQDAAETLDWLGAAAELLRHATSDACAAALADDGECCTAEAGSRLERAAALGGAVQHFAAAAGCLRRRLGRSAPMTASFWDDIE